MGVHVCLRFGNEMGQSWCSPTRQLIGMPDKEQEPISRPVVTRC